MNPDGSLFTHSILAVQAASPTSFGGEHRPISSLFWPYALFSHCVKPQSQNIRKADWKNKRKTETATPRFFCSWQSNILR